MALNDSYAPRHAIATAGQTVISIPWPFLAATDLIVAVNNVLQVLTSDYTVILPTSFASPAGTITFLTGLNASDTVIIQRSTPTLQETDFASAGPFSAETFEDAFDRGMLISQEVHIGKTVFLAAGDGTPDVTGAKFAIAEGTATITDFDGGQLGQRLVVLLTGSNTNFTDGGTLSLAGGISFTSGVSGDVISFVATPGPWVEMSRSINS